MMLVTCETIDDFVVNLKDVQSDGVFNKVVWVNVNRRPLDGTRHDALKFQVEIHASCVVCLPNGDQYLLVGGEDCGKDYEDSGAERKGSERAKVLREGLALMCANKGWMVRPGSVSE